MQSLGSHLAFYQFFPEIYYVHLVLEGGDTILYLSLTKYKITRLNKEDRHQNFQSHEKLRSQRRVDLAARWKNRIMWGDVGALGRNTYAENPLLHQTHMSSDSSIICAL
jgi:hypothetical protein